MTAGIWDFTIEQGATFTTTILIEDEGVARDLTNVTDVRLKARSTIGDQTVLLNLALGSGFTIPTPTNGEILVLISATDTAALDFVTAAHDLEIEYSDGTVDRQLKGTITLDKEATRP